MQHHSRTNHGENSELLVLLNLIFGLCNFIPQVMMEKTRTIRVAEPHENNLLLADVKYRNPVFRTSGISN